MLRFSFISTSKGRINSGFQKVPEDLEKAKVDLLGTGKIFKYNEKTVLIINEMPTGRVWQKSVPAFDWPPSKGAFLNNDGSENKFQKVIISYKDLGQRG